MEVFSSIISNTLRELTVNKYIKGTMALFCLLSSNFSFADSYKKGETFYDLETDQKYSGIVHGYSQDIDEGDAGSSYRVDHKSYYDFTIEVKNGKRHGTSKLYKKYVRLINGKVTVTIDRYLHTEVKFSNGIPLWIKDYQEDGSLKTATKMRNGVAERFSKNGLLVSRFEYITKGEFKARETAEVYKEFLGNTFALHGKYTAFFENGSVHRERTYNKNVAHGEFISYHENGNVLQKGHYVQGKKDGEYIYKCEDGRISTHVEYLMGDVIRTHVNHDYNYCYDS